MLLALLYVFSSMQDDQRENKEMNAFTCILGVLSKEYICASQTGFV